MASALIACYLFTFDINVIIEINLQKIKNVVLCGVCACHFWRDCTGSSVVDELASVLEVKAREFYPIVKSGRTHVHGVFSCAGQRSHGDARRAGRPARAQRDDAYHCAQLVRDIGYLQAAEVAKEAMATGRTIREVVVAR